MAIMIPDPDATKKAKAIFLGADFGRAFCQHFGLPAGQVLTVSPHADRDEIMHAKVEIALTADDLAGIAAIMGGAKPPKAPSLDRLPVVSMGMDKANGPDMTAVCEAATFRVGEDGSLKETFWPWAASEGLCRNEPGATIDPMEATRALVKKHGGGSGG